jgi:hypothetical protein
MPQLRTKSDGAKNNFFKKLEHILKICHVTVFVNTITKMEYTEGY